MIPKIREPLLVVDVIGFCGDFERSFTIGGNTETEILEQFNNLVEHEKGTGWEYYLPILVYELINTGETQ